MSGTNDWYRVVVDDYKYEHLVCRSGYLWWTKYYVFKRGSYDKNSLIMTFPTVASPPFRKLRDAKALMKLMG